ncbi:MAG: hypothetical protein A2X95_05925 [Syntrophobacterales bacterium GWF2_56_9]|nr:MAG: hypothetical protein A2X95_05925 [Syntrophobacterales bacterium GWF2_56_9]
MVLNISGLTLSLGEGVDLLPARAASLLGLSEEVVTDLRVLRRSIDARRARPPRFIYLVSVRLPDGVAWRPGEHAIGVSVTVETKVPEERPAGPSGGAPATEQRPVVAGCGPAGLFAALTLVLRGLPVLLLERGKAVPERLSDVRYFWEKGILNPESHVHFGEGGAGTFSDGKLTSRVKNRYTGWIKQVLVDMGAPAGILTDARPHIGTDRLQAVVVNLRNRLIEMGCEIRFGARVTDFLIRKGKLIGLVVNGAEQIRTDHLLLAIGQSADDTCRKLAERGVSLAMKPFAVGLRVEHPQEVINRIQYGRWSGHPDLPPADYFLTAKIENMNRSVYSFCMCPGGRVIGCSAQEGGVITNGMSRFCRDSPYANSAVVVNVRVDDLGGESPLAGLAFRRHWEERAFLAGGGNYFAPAQRLTDFLAGREGSPGVKSSFLPGVREADLREVLPSFVVAALKSGFASFERKMPGFITGEANLIGVETRTSSPVRIIRGKDGQSVTATGLFPCGEGAGYAGGLISSALDGIRAAERLIDSLGN